MVIDHCHSLCCSFRFRLTALISIAGRFKVTNTDNEMETHLSVLEFDSEEGQVILPDWVFGSIGLELYTRVSIRLCTLPKASKVVFQPQEHVFSQLVDARRTLQQKLSSFVALTRGDCITIEVDRASLDLDPMSSPQLFSTPSMDGSSVSTASSDSRSTELHLRVAEVSDSPDVYAVSIFDCDLQVDFLASAEAAPAATEAVMLSTDGVTTSDPVPLMTTLPYRIKWSNFSASSTRQLKISVAIMTNEPIDDLTAHLSAPMCLLSFQRQASLIEHPKNFGGLEFSIVKAGSAKPSLSSASTATSSACTLTASLQLECKDVTESMGWCFLTMCCVPQTFSRRTNLSAYTDLTGDELTAAFDALLSHRSVPWNCSVSISLVEVPTVSAPAPLPLDQCERCPNCRILISNRALSMHSLQCERHMWYCELCQSPHRYNGLRHSHCNDCQQRIDFICPDSVHRRPFRSDPMVSHEAMLTYLRSLQWHHQLSHGEARCPQCQKRFPSQQLLQHINEQCEARRVQCKWCRAPVSLLDRDQHQQHCSSLSIPCGICQAPVPRRRLPIHLAVEHNINPSLAPPALLGQSSEENMSPSSDFDINKDALTDDLQHLVDPSELEMQQQLLSQFARPNNVWNSSSPPNQSAPAPQIDSPAPARQPHCPFCMQDFDDAELLQSHVETCDAALAIDEEFGSNSDHGSWD